VLVAAALAGLPAEAHLSHDLHFLPHVEEFSSPQEIGATDWASSKPPAAAMEALHLLAAVGSYDR